MGKTTAPEIFDTNELDVAAILKASGWQQTHITLTTNPNTGKCYGRFHFEVPGGVTRDNFMQQLHNGKLQVEPKTLLSARKDLKYQVDDMARRER